MEYKLLQMAHDNLLNGDINQLKSIINVYGADTFFNHYRFFLDNNFDSVSLKYQYFCDMTISYNYEK